MFRAEIFLPLQFKPEMGKTMLCYLGQKFFCPCNLNRKWAKQCSVIKGRNFSAPTIFKKLGITYVSFSLAGNSTMNDVPLPYSLSAQILPSCSSTNCLTIDNPSPVEDSPPVG